MTEKNTNNTTERLDSWEANFIEFVPEEDANVSSAEMIRDGGSSEMPKNVKIASYSEGEPRPAMTEEEAAEENEGETFSRVFKQLSEPKLPELSKENRAKLLLQSPNRLFFYWSVGKNPFQTLNRALSGQNESYTLVAKLIDLKRDTEEIHAVEAEGSFWFNVDADTRYRAEIGFHAVNRPYIRVIHSNDVETPRKSPSPRAASTADWTVSADRFAVVLDVAGFSQDAFDVAIAGGDWEASKIATHSAFSQFIGKPKFRVTGFGPEELRYAMFVLASGVPLEYLRWRINASLFAILQENAENLTEEKALAALHEQFDFDSGEVLEEQTGSAVFGASLINFPRKLRKNWQFPKFEPVSSVSSGQNHPW